MVSDPDILAMEKIIVEHAGPMGKFIIKKAITDLAISPEDHDREKIKQFVNLVLERSIFDTAKWDSVRKEIFAAWGK